MARCVVVSAAEIKNYEKVKSYFKSDDFFVFCDGGLNHIKKLGVKPNLIIGDFDSACKNDFDISQIETIELPCQKDDTDTFFAVKEALNRGFDDFLCVGCIGNRFDHSLCNVSVLLYLQEKNVKAILVDDYSEMQIVGSKKVYIEDSFSYFSLMCVAVDLGPAVVGADALGDPGGDGVAFQLLSAEPGQQGQDEELCDKVGGHRVSRQTHHGLLPRFPQYGGLA
ncbi:MAG: thiamine diphosphokinase, partial [Treponema sp.]|nr:thiamine diphosphokinase [Treponema sp.]